MVKRICILIFLCLVVAQINAQRTAPRRNRFVATDYNECQMGIKDSLGNWVVKAQYIMIEELSDGDFEVTDYEKHGVIDGDGKVIVPMIYDRVHTTYYTSNQFYTVELKKRCGIIDRNGKVIVPCYYREITGNSDTTFSARVSFRKWYLIHRDGTRSRVPWKSWWSPIEIDSGLYQGERGRWFLHDKFGAYDDSGHVVLRRKYFEITSLGYNHILKIASRKRRGYFTTQLDTIWPMIFDYNASGYRRIRGTYFWFYTYASNDGVIQEVKDGKVGLISMTGDTVLPFNYDYARIIGYSGNHSVWEISRGMESGIFESYKGWIIPVSITGMNTVASYYHDSDSSYFGIFTGLRNDKCGMQTTTGDIIVPYEFPSMRRSGNSIFFISDDSVLCVTFTNAETRHRLMVGSDTIRSSDYSDWFGGYLVQFNSAIEMIPDSGSFSVSVKEPGWKLYYHPGHLNDTLRHPETGKPVPLDEKKVSDFPNHQLNASVFEVRTLKPRGKLEGDGGTYYEFTQLDFAERPETTRLVIENIHYDNDSFFRVDFVENSISDKQHDYFWTEEGLLFRDDHKILSDRRYYMCSFQQTIPDSTVYFQLEGFHTGEILDTAGNYVFSPHKNVGVNDFNAHYTWVNTRPYKIKDHWKLIDNATNKVAYDDGRHWGAHPALVGEMLIDYGTKSGWFLYNVAQHKTIAEGYDEIQPLDLTGQSFLIRSCSGKYGIMNKDGALNVDTAWSYFTPYYFYGGVSYTGWWSTNYDKPCYRYIVLYNHKGSLVYNVLDSRAFTGKRTLVDSALVAVDSFSIQMANIYDLDETIKPATIRIFVDSANLYNMQPWQYSVVYDSVFTRKRLEYYNPDYVDGFSSFTSCHYCGKKTKRYYYPSPNDYDESNFYEIHFVSPTAISMSGFSAAGTRRWYTNCVMTDSIVQPVTLQWLFDPRTDWKNYLINAVINYVNTHLNVQGDCHNPAGLPILLNEDFLIAKDGIELYPEGFYENDKQLMILLPWKEVSPYLTPGMRAVLPIPADN